MCSRLKQHNLCAASLNGTTQRGKKAFQWDDPTDHEPFDGDFSKGQVGLRLVTLYASIIAYGTAPFLAGPGRAGVAGALGGVVGGGAARRQDVSVPEPSGHRV